MRNIASCYSQHAIKVSDSYCSGHHSNPSYHSPNLNIPPSQDSVICVYKAKFSTTSSHHQKQIFLTIKWCSHDNIHPHQGLILSFSEVHPSSSSSSSYATPKFDKSDSFNLKDAKGTKTFLSSFNSMIQLFWDLSMAKYGAGPEPLEGYYVFVLVNSELSLVLGDMSEDETNAKKLIRNVPSGNLSLISRMVNFSSGNCNSMYSAKGQFCDEGACHEIVIECIDIGDQQDQKGSLSSDHDHPVLSVSVDKKDVVRVKRLRWNFRGNQTLFIDGLRVDLMWDVHDWYYNQRNRSNDKKSSKMGVFMFRTRSGLDSRLWVEEKKDDDKAGFSFTICGTKSPD